MSSSDYILLAGYYRVNPWGPWRDDLRVGHMTAMLYNINRAQGKPPLGADDFIFDPQRAEKEAAKNEAMTIAALDSLAAQRSK